MSEKHHPNWGFLFTLMLVVVGEAYMLHTLVTGMKFDGEVYTILLIPGIEFRTELDKFAFLMGGAMSLLGFLHWLVKYDNASLYRQENSDG